MLPASIPPKPTHVGGPVLGFAGNELSVRRAQVGDVEQVQAGPPRPLMRRIDKAPARQSLRGSNLMPSKWIHWRRVTWL